MKDISKMNISLLCKWWWKLEMENGLWQDIVKAKYLSNDLISSAKWRLTDSPVWKDLLQVRTIYMRGRAIKNGNGTKTLFWKDPWIDPNPLCSMHPVLFEMCTEKDISVHNFLLRHGHIDFHRWLSPILFEQWLGVVDRVYSFPFTNESDRIIWKWNKKSGLFTTKSTYDWLTSGDAGMHFRHIWKAKIPYKIKIFVWLLEQNAILTKDNMIKRNWVGDPTCFFCSLPETRDHLFFECVVAKVVWGVIGRCFGADNTPRGLTQYKDWIRRWMPSGGTFHTFGLAAVCWAIWKCRNMACFDKKMIKNPAEIILHAGAYMNYWAGLYNAEMKGMLEDDVKVILSYAYRALSRQGQARPLLQLAAPPDVHDDSDHDEE